MSVITIICIAVGLSMDALAVAIAAAATLSQVSPRHVFRLAFHFGLFQALMPIAGWLAGMQLARFVSTWDHWIAFGLLSFVGGKAIRQALTNSDEAAARDDPTRGLTLVGLAVATSIDALAVGVTLAASRVAVWQPSIIIGCTTCAITAIGMMLGGRLGRRFGKRMEIAGGLVLIAIGLKILIDHYQ